MREDLDIINAVLEWLLEKRQRSRLSPKLGHAIADELGISLKKQKRDAADKSMEAVKSDIEEIAARMERDDEQLPVGGLQVAAVTEKATELGMSYERLAQRIKRYNKRDREAGLKDLARIFKTDYPTDPLIAQIRDAMIKRQRKKSRGSPI